MVEAMIFCLFAGILISNLHSANSHPGFLKMIPNSKLVEDPCNAGQIVKAIGHKNPNGGGPANAFGKDFGEHRNWAKICQMDSDGDGKTNGQELGDPNCVWEEGDIPASTTGITHPGICDPVDSAVCIKKNVCDRVTEKPSSGNPLQGWIQNWIRMGVITWLPFLFL